MRFALVDTPLGQLTLASSDGRLSSIHFGRSVPGGAELDAASNRVFIQQIDEYLQGTRTEFDFPLDLNGTPFQLAVWKQLLAIPYGETRTYGEIAKQIGKPGAARAVGMANHDNPIPIVVPCHRVIGHNGSLTGYGGGLHIKRQLLTIEKRTLTF